MAYQRRCPGCLRLITDRCSVCKPERSEYDLQRGSATKRGYDSTWRRFRASMLAEHPTCEDCEQNDRITAATEVHHIVKLRERRDLRLEPTNVMCLCKACHSIRTARGE